MSFIAFVLWLYFAFRIYLHVTDQHVSFHSQNLSRDGHAERTWRQGRCWWHLYPNDDRKVSRYPSPTINPEWHLFDRSSTQIGFQFAGEEEDWLFRISVDRLFYLSLSLEGIPLFYKFFKDIREGWGYETSISFHDGSLWIHVLYNERWGAHTVKWKWVPDWISIWAASGQKGYGFYISMHFDTLILGARKHLKVELWPEPITAPIPIEPDNTLGFSYVGQFMLERHAWWRARFPWRKKIHHYVDIQVEHPPMFAGKGESDWDIDDDGIFGMGVPGTTLEEAIKGYQDAVYRNRDKYGMPDVIDKAQRGAAE